MTLPVEPSRGVRPWHWLLLLVGVIVLGVGAWLWRTLDPFVLDRPANKAAKRLLDTAVQRPLTAEEFAEALALLESGESVARLSALSVVQLEGERDAGRRPAALAAVDRCRQSEDPGTARAAAAVAARMNAAK